MKRFAVTMIVALVVLSFAFAALAAAPKAFDQKAAVGTLASDPVSNVEFAIAETSPSSELEGKFYYFENEANKAAFDKDPAQYNK